MKDTELMERLLSVVNDPEDGVPSCLDNIWMATSSIIGLNRCLLEKLSEEKLDRDHLRAIIKGVDIICGEISSEAFSAKEMITDSLAT